jgi:hypothetical protein
VNSPPLPPWATPRVNALASDWMSAKVTGSSESGDPVLRVSDEGPKIAVKLWTANPANEK